MHMHIYMYNYYTPFADMQCIGVYIQWGAIKLLLTNLSTFQSELNIVASFDRRGERIVTGSSKGKVHLRKCMYV